MVGAIDVPDGKRRLHKVATPRFGGVSILISVATTLALISVLSPGARAGIITPRLFGAVPAIVIVAIAGVLDDVFNLSASTKLVVEIVAAAVAFVGGYRFDSLFSLPLGALCLPATVVWIVAVTNAFNLVDGMDALASGVGVIIGSSLFAFALYLGALQETLMLAALTGALIGFLPFNLPPARIFLGDSGSLSVGMILALVSIDASNKLAAGIALVVPALAMGLPLAEITITVLRRALRRVHVVRRGESKEEYQFLFVGAAAVFSADSDHIHHRLLSLGLSKRRAVLTLYTATLLACAAGFMVSISRGVNQALILTGCGIAAIGAVRYLKYEELRPLSRGTLMPLFEIRGLNLRLFHTLFDLLCIILSYLVAFLTVARAGGSPIRPHLLLGVPLICFGQLSVLICSGMYRRAYRYASIADIAPVSRSIMLAGLLGFLSTALMTGVLPTMVSLLDTYFLGTLIVASRFSFRLLDHAHSENSRNGHSVLIYGAGRGGQLALTEMRSNPSLDRFAIGFLDDDSHKHGSRVSGLPVYGGPNVSTLIEKRAFAELLVASNKIPDERVRDISFRCANVGIPVRMLAVEWRDVPKEGSRHVKAVSRFALLSEAEFEKA